MHVVGFVDAVGRDLRFALRGLSRRPTFTFAAVLTLALGIGATTAIFSVVYSVLIKPLPYPNADELVQIRYSAAGYPSLPSPPSLYFTYRDENRTFASSGLWQPGGITLTGLGEPERVNALRVSDGIFRALGVQPMRGRSFTEEEYRPAAEGPAPVILSYAFWQRRFGGDEAIIGRELSSREILLEGQDNSVDSRPSQVVGVMPPDFRFLELTPQPDVILALQLSPPAEAVTGENYNFGSLARLKPGVTLAEARTDVERMLSLWLEAVPIAAREENRLIATVRPLKEDLVGSIASTLWVLMGAIGAVLFVACANIANLMLVRADGRRQELAVRAALGAGRARIARESLVESLVLGAAGGVLGLLLAYLGLKALVAIGPSDLPRLREIGVYPPVLAFAVAVSLASTLLFGSITALKDALRVDTLNSLVPRGATTSRERSATRSALVVAQVALALVLAVSAGLMIRTFQALRDVDPGFTDPATIQTVRIPIPQALFLRPRASRAPAARDARQGRGDSGRRFGRLYGKPSAGKVCVEHHVDRGRRPNAGDGRHAARAPEQVRLARVLRSHGHSNHRGTRPHVERHRSGRQRYFDFRGFRSRVRGRACRRARKTYPAVEQLRSMARGYRCGAARA